MKIRDPKPLKKKKPQRKQSETPSVSLTDDESLQFKQRYGIVSPTKALLKKKNSKKMKKSQSMKNIFDDTNGGINGQTNTADETQTSEPSENDKTNRGRSSSLDLGNTLTPMMTTEGQNPSTMRTTKMLNEQMYALLRSDMDLEIGLNEEKVSEEEKQQSVDMHAPVPTEETIPSWNVYKGIHWCISSGQSLCSLGLMFGYYHAWNGGAGNWEQYKWQRRACLLSNIGFGLVSVCLQYKGMNEGMFPWMMVPKIIHSVVVPLFVVYVEYFKQADAAKYGFWSLYGSYVLDLLTDKFQMTLLTKIGLFKKSIELRQSSTQIATEAVLL